jgi:hypothetical protein
LIDYKIYCPSYKRSELAIAHKLFNPDKFIYVVRESETEKYKSKFPDVAVMSIPEGSVTNIADTRNWILNNKQSEYVMMTDDDLKSVHWLLNRKLKYLDNQEIEQILNNGFQMALDLKCGLWGMNLMCDPMAYSINKPIQLSRPVLSPLCGILDNELRYDEALTLKEDYDYYLQSLRKYRKVLRYDFLSYLVDHQKLQGGCQTYRTKELEKEQADLFQKKWGSDIVKRNKRRPDSINMRISPPL